MFDNIGSKLKVFAKVLFWIMTVLYVILGIVVIAGSTHSGYRYSYTDESAIVSGILLMLLGPLLSWVFAAAIYAFGELVDKTSSTERRVSNIEKHLFFRNKPQPDNRQFPPETPSSNEYCRNCGAAIASSSQFCQDCGAALHGGDMHVSKPKGRLGRCHECDKEAVIVRTYKVVDSYGTRYRDLCDSCADNIAK